MVEKVSNTRGLGFALVAIIAALGIWYWSSRQTEAPQIPGAKNSMGLTPSMVDPVRGGPGTAAAVPATQPPPKEEMALPPVRASRFQNTALTSTYVGTDACANCHADECASYLKTSHSRSLREVDPALEPPDGELSDPSSRRSYQVYREAGQVRHRETLQIDDDQQVDLANHAVDYVVGSGHYAYTYLVKTADGFLTESPATWYATLQNWALSPGFETNNSGFARAVYVECLFCHTGRTESVDGNRARVKIHSMSIDCERCHGPGSLHVEKQNANSDATPEIDLTIVNPAHLSRTQNEAICAQCHLDSAAEADVRGRGLRDFLPGQWLEDYRVYYGMQIPKTEMKVVGHVEQLRLSNCYRGSETLTCTTCHDSHHAIAPENRVDVYRAKCLACHTQQPCGLPEAKRLEASPNDDCMHCHMPSSPSELLHLPATHHRIGIHTAGPPLPDSATVGDLIPLGDITNLPQLDQDRCLGLGYLDASVGERNPQVSEAYRVRSRDILEDVIARGLEDADMDAALAKIYQRENPPKAIQLAESALQSPNLQPDTRTQVLFALSNSYLNLEQTDLAIRPLEQLVQFRRQAGDWFLLGVCRYRAGDIQGALQAAQRAVEIRPDSPNFHALLAELYQHSGQSELAEMHELRAKQLTGPQPAAP